MRGYLAVLTLALLAPGCAEFQDHHYRFANRLRAHHAWKSFGTNCDSFAAPTGDFRDGWETGYYDVLTGGQPDPPAVPPKRYWNPRYQTPEGQAAIDEWYAGYEAGAMLATGSPIESELPVRDGGLESSFGPGLPPPHHIPDHDVIPNHEIIPEHEYSPPPTYIPFPVSMAPARTPERSRPPAGKIRIQSHAAVRTASGQARVHQSASYQSQHVRPVVKEIAAPASVARAVSARAGGQPKVHWGSKRAMFAARSVGAQLPVPRRLIEPLTSVEPSMVVFRKPVAAVESPQMTTEGWHPH